MTTLLVACNPQQPADTNTVGPSVTPNQTADFNVAVDFINAYTTYHLTESAGIDGVTDWIAKHPSLTEGFKTAHKQLLETARKNEPEVGLGFDPIVDAQDFPDKGFAISKTDTLNGYVTVSGVDSPDFEVVLKVVQQNNRSLVDGAGVINIPEEKRPKRR
jgi:hypothetical protein